MQDRVSLYPGRVKLEPVAGQANLYDLTRADQPTQEGTPLNKANLLKDATAALLGGNESMVPDEAFKALCDKLTIYRQLAVFDQAGAFEFAVPANVTHILAFIVSGGGSGTACSVTSKVSGNYIGGSSGTIEVFSADDVAEGDVFNVVVGAGGAAVSARSGSSASGNAGGSSAFGGTVASGSLFAGESINTSSVETSANIQAASMNIAMPMHIFLAITLMSAMYHNEKMLTNLSAGGSTMSIVYSGASSASVYAQPATTFPNGKKSSAGKAVSSGNATASKGTDFGCGGGAAVSVGSAYTARSAAGMNGVVAVWGY